MNKFKKVVSSLAVTVFVMGAAMPIFASPFSDVKDGDAISSAAQRLNSLKIMQGSQNADGTYSFNGSGMFTRAMAAKVFVAAKGLSAVKSSQKVFEDVASTNWAFNWVNVANQYGIVQGSIDSKTKKNIFNPNDNVTYGQLATMAVRTLGYKDSDLDGTTWPYNYVQKATELGILDDLANVDVESAATRADVAEVVNKTLDTATKSEQAKVEASTTAYTAKSFFETEASKFGVKAISGGIISDTSLVDSSLKANQFKIAGDSTVYTLPNASEDFSGNFYKKMGTSFYVDKNDNTKVIFFDESQLSGTVKDNVSINLSSGTTVGYKDTTVTLSDGSNPITTYTTVANPVLAINGQIVDSSAVATNLANNALAPAGSTTTVKLIDANADGIYDAIVVTRAKAPVMVTTAPTSDTVVPTTLATTNIAYNGGTISLLKSTDSSVASIVTVTGAASKLTDIKADDIIYAYPTVDNSAVKLEVVRNKVSGTVTTVNPGSASANSTVVINGVTCNFAFGGSVPTTSTTLNAGNILGTKGTFVVDKSNKIYKATLDSDSALSTSATVGGAVYGYLTAAAPASTDGWGTATPAKIKVLKVDGTTQEVSVTNGAYTQAQTILADSDKLNNLVYYVTANNDSNGYVTAVNSAAEIAFKNTNLGTDTYIYNIAADGTTTVVKKADISLPTDADSASIAYAVKNNNVMGDYYAVVFNNRNTVNTINNLTIVGSYIGQELVNKVTVNDYNVIENGVAKVMKFANVNADGTAADSSVTGIATLSKFTGAVANADGVITKVTAVDPANVIATGAVQAKDAVRIRVNNTIYALDSTLKVTVKNTDGTVAVGSMNDVIQPADGTASNVTMVKDATTGNILMIVVIK
jgi:hypothetical protein